MTTELSKETFQEMIMNNKNLAIVQFRTEWSGACQIIDPIFKELVKSYESQVDFFNVDADKEKYLFDQYSIMELPTILFFRSGELIDHAVGLTSKNKLIAKIENALASLN